MIEIRYCFFLKSEENVISGVSRMLFWESFLSVDFGRGRWEVSTRTSLWPHYLEYIPEFEDVIKPPRGWTVEDARGFYT